MFFEEIELAEGGIEFIDELFGTPTHMDLLARENRDNQRELIYALTAMRERRDLSQETVAELMGISPEAVAGIESGERDVRLSTLFHYSLAVNAKVMHQVIAYEDDIILIEERIPDPLDFYEWSLRDEEFQEDSEANAVTSSISFDVNRDQNEVL